MRFRIIFLLSFLLGVCAAQSQVFQDVSSLLSEFDEISADGCFAGCGVSFYDFNKDGLDDLSFGGVNSNIRLFENTGTGFIELESIPNSGEAKHILWADIDNDGDADLFVSKFQDQCKLYLNDGNGQMLDITEGSGLPININQENFGAAFGDYDRDGFLDLYICNYNSTQDESVIENYLLKNNGNGTFEDVTFESGVGNGVQLSLGAVWLDYNKDQWPDLFVFNDKTIYDNALYLNNADGTFTDVANFLGVNQSINAMSGTTGDYNNDGWLDIYVSNGPVVGNLLLKNNDGFSFIESAASAGVQTFDMCWSAQWIDFDNNMWQDLYVAVRDWDALPTANHFYINNQDNSFTHDESQVHFPNDDKIGWSNATGDFNDDGFTDLVQFSDGASSLGLWQNEGGTNHFLKFGLEGIVSNRDGIGCWIECHAGEITQNRYTYCGEDYLSQDSQYEIFGLSATTYVDSLVVYWPSGVKDVLYNIEADQSMLITEGMTLSASLIHGGQSNLCEGDSMLFEVGDFAYYTWYNGSNEPFIYVSGDEIIWVEVTDEFGFTYTSNVEQLNIIALPEFEVDVQDISCFSANDGGITIVPSNGPLDVIWEEDIEGLQNSNLGPGIYYFSISDIQQGCEITDSVLVIEPDIIQVSGNISPVLCQGDDNGTIEIELSGGTGVLTIDWGAIIPDALSAGEYFITVTDDNGCEFEFGWMIVEPPALAIELVVASPDEQYTLSAVVQGGVAPYTYLWSNGESGTSIIEPTDGDSYYVLVTDINGCTLTSETLVFTSVTSIDHRFPSMVYDSILEIIHISDIPNDRCTISVWTTEGKLALSSPVGEGRKTIGITDLPEGVYVVGFGCLDGSMSKTIRIVK